MLPRLTYLTRSNLKITVNDSGMTVGRGILSTKDYKWTDILKLTQDEESITIHIGKKPIKLFIIEPNLERVDNFRELVNKNCTKFNITAD